MYKTLSYFKNWALNLKIIAQIFCILFIKFKNNFNKNRSNKNKSNKNRFNKNI